MGKRARGLRSFEKRLAKQYGYKEYDVGSDGELVRPKNKAQARRAFLRARARDYREAQIMARLMAQVHEDICAVEDARVFAILDEVARAAV